MKLDQLKEELKKVDEVQLLELLEVTAEDIVERFEDIIKLKKAHLSKEFEDGNLQERIEELDFD